MSLTGEARTWQPTCVISQVYPLPSPQSSPHSTCERLKL